MGCGKSKEPTGYNDAEHEVSASTSTETKSARERVKDLYMIGTSLGSGGFAVVKEATHRETGRSVAIKIINLPRGDTPDAVQARNDVKREIAVLQELKCPQIMDLLEVFVDDKKAYMVCEVIRGGELLQAVIDAERYGEEEAKVCFAQLIIGLQYLHAHGIIHRDIKLENILLEREGDISRVKIADFGLAKKAADTAMQTICGTPQYVAPEILNAKIDQRYDTGADMWSAGVCLFILLGGYPPFYDEQEARMFRDIKAGNFSFDDTAENAEIWRAVSDDAKDLIKKLLCVDPTARPTATDVLSHPWIRGTGAGQSHTSNLTGTVARMRFQKGIKKVIAVNRFHLE